jgi:hypothetical protein
VRIGVRESGAGELGSVFYDLDVPDFTKGDIAMSGLLMTAASSRLLLTPEPDAMVPTTLLPGPATSRREFLQGDTLNLFAEVYDNTRGHRRDIEVVTTLLAETGTDVFRSTQSLSADRPGTAKNSSFQYSTTIPLKDIAPGRYLLRVDASARGAASDSSRVSRETLVTVVGK